MNSRRSGKRPRCFFRSSRRPGLASSLAGWLGLGFLCAGAQEAPRWSDDTAMVAFFQAAREIAANSVQGDTTTVTRIAHQSFSAYLRETDPYARLLSPEEHARVRELALPQYAGIAMTVTRDNAGFLVCFPFPDGPAARAGVKEGDVLVAVEGREIPAEEPVERIGTQVRGEAGTPVRLSVASYAREPREVSVTRAHVQARTVFATGSNTWRVLSFEPGTDRELARALFFADLTLPVTLDLRGNPGGSLAAAIDSARLFLPAGTEVVSVKTRQGTTVHSTRGNGPYSTWPRLILRQDGATASSAEVFIAALTHNRRAVSAGSTHTYGKRVTQRTLDLVGGGALVFTDGWLMYPAPIVAGTHVQGLAPDVRWEETPGVSGSSLADQVLERAYSNGTLTPRKVQP